MIEERRGAVTDIRRPRVLLVGELVYVAPKLLG
jgi:hypothetical protein